MKMVLGALVLTTVLAGCGGGDSSSVAAKTPSTSAAKTYVESATCRKRLGTFLDIAQADKDAARLAYDSFDDNYQRLQKSVDNALAACSPQVALPVRSGMFKESLADLTFGMCSVNSCPEVKIAAKFHAAQASFARARTMLDRTQ